MAVPGAFAEAFRSTLKRRDEAFGPPRKHARTEETQSDDAMSAGDTPKWPAPETPKNTYTRAAAYDPLGDFDIDEFLASPAEKHPAEVDLLPSVGRSNWNIADLIKSVA